MNWNNTTKKVALREATNPRIKDCRRTDTGRHNRVGHGSIFADPVQSSPWMDPVRVQLCDVSSCRGFQESVKRRKLAISRPYPWKRSRARLQNNFIQRKTLQGSEDECDPRWLDSILTWKKADRIVWRRSELDMDLIHPLIGLGWFRIFRELWTLWIWLDLIGWWDDCDPVFN